MRSEAARDRRPTTLWKHDPNLILAGEFLVPEETGWDGRRWHPACSPTYMVSKGLKISTVCAGLTFFGIIPLEMPCFFTQRLPLSFVFENGHATRGLWLVKLHLRCAGVWLYPVDGWRRWCVCENSYRRPGHICGPRLHFEIYPTLLLPLRDPI